MFVRFSSAFRILNLYDECFHFKYIYNHNESCRNKIWLRFFQKLIRDSSDVYNFLCRYNLPEKKTYKIAWKTYRSLSSAACDASESLAVAEAKRSSERSKSSSSSWMRRLRAATSDSAYRSGKISFLLIV